MFDNALTVAILTVLVMCALFLVYTKFVSAKKENPDGSTQELITKVLALLHEQMSVAFETALELKKADENGFESVKDFVLDKIMEFIKATDKLTEIEKSFLSRQLLDKILSPYLKDLWDYKLDSTSKNMTKATLDRIKENGGV